MKFDTTGRACMSTNSAKRQRRSLGSMQTEERLYTGRTAQLDVVNRLISPANFAQLRRAADIGNGCSSIVQRMALELCA
jgi:hypothetical protein